MLLIICNNCSQFILKWFEPNSYGEIYVLRDLQVDGEKTWQFWGLLCTKSGSMPLSLLCPWWICVEMCAVQFWPKFQKKNLHACEIILTSLAGYLFDQLEGSGICTNLRQKLQSEEVRKSGCGPQNNRQSEGQYQQHNRCTEIRGDRDGDRAWGGGQCF